MSSKSANLTYLDKTINYLDLARKNDFDIILPKIKSNKVLRNIKDDYGNTFLHYALINKNITVSMNLILNSGIDLNFQNNLGDTPLHVACYNLLHSLKNKDVNIHYYFEIIILLLNNGAKQFMLNNEILLPFDYLKDINTLVDQNGNTLLHIVIKNCKMHIATFIIDHLNFNLDTQNNNGETAVHLSVFNAIKYFDNIEFFYFLNFLYKKGFNEYIKDSLGFTAGYYLENIFK